VGLCGDDHATAGSSPALTASHWLASDRPSAHAGIQGHHPTSLMVSSHTFWASASVMWLDETMTASDPGLVKSAGPDHRSPAII
jgi:hypothetical protein